MTVVWLGKIPIMLTGLAKWPKFDDRNLIRGELRRVVVISDRYRLERELS